MREWVNCPERRRLAHEEETRGRSGRNPRIGGVKSIWHTHRTIRLRPASISTAAICALLLAGCGKSEETGVAPIACLSGADAYLTALEGAPNRVKLSGGTEISQCIAPRQAGGEMATIGSDLVAATTTLNAKALADPSGPWSLRAGYLLGAVEKAAWSSNGIHTDLVRRLEVAASYVPSGTSPEVLQPGLDQGLEAGRTRG